VGPCKDVEVRARKSICLVVSDIRTAEAFLLGHMAAMANAYDVYLVANCADNQFLKRRGLAVDVLCAPLVRDVSPIRDLACLYVLFGIFRQRKFDAVHSVTPKAGLLAMLAASLARIPVRIHTFTGQVWATRAGLGRMLLRNLDRLLATCATHLLVDSHSQKEFLLRRKVVTPGKASVLADGSISGVDTQRFRPSPEDRSRIRQRERMAEDGVVFLYVGRLKVDKGVLDLAEAFSQLCEDCDNAWLLMVGRDEEDLRWEIQARCGPWADRSVFVDWTTTPEQYMASADVLCLPSYREGFGSVIIEAAACEVPSLASRIYGVTDAVVENVTGVLHEPGAVQELTDKMRHMAREPAWRNAMGKRARIRVESEFAQNTVTAALLQYYSKVLRQS
jgi:glycosyltransferase involved in cell wall biosynthesis